MMGGMNGKSSLPRPSTLLAALALFFFLAVLVIPDGAEQYRAWKASLSWTEAERAAAGAEAAGRQHGLALAALVCSTYLVCASAVAAFLLGAGVALERRGAHAAAAGLCASCAVFGLAYAALTVAYRLGLGATRVIRGPLRDFDLSLRPTILIGSIALAILSLALPIVHFLGRPREALSGEESAQKA